MKIAILGGSFNPIHNGHIALAKRVVDYLSYDKVLFIPAYNPPHKKLASGATDADRLCMVKNAIEPYSCFGLESCEIDREGVSYTIDTVHYLEDKYGSQLTEKIGLIIGDDLIPGFHLWKNVENLANITDVLLATRLTSSQKHNLPCNYIEMYNDVVDVSSEKIRNFIKRGEHWEDLVPVCVRDYIVHNKLYYEYN